VLPNLRFPREFGLVFFCGFAGFLKAGELLVFGLVLIKICLFFGIVFCSFLYYGLLFFKFYGHFALSIYCKTEFVPVFV